MNKSLIALVTVIFHGAAGRQEFLPGAPIERGLLPAVDEDALIKSGSIADPELNEDAARWAARIDQRASQEFQLARQDVLAERASLKLGETKSDVVRPVLDAVVGNGSGMALPPVIAAQALVPVTTAASTELSSGTSSTGAAAGPTAQPGGEAASPFVDTAADAVAAPAPAPTPAAKGSRR